MNDYSFGVGREGAERLDLVNNIFGPHSRRFLVNAGLREGISVLEVGCGSGNMTAFLAERVGPAGRVVAADASPKQIEIARERCSQAGHHNVTFVCEQAEGLDLPGQRFDLACCRLVLMHLLEPRPVVARIAGLLVPGGDARLRGTNHQYAPHAASLRRLPSRQRSLFACREDGGDRPRRRRPALSDDRRGGAPTDYRALRPADSAHPCG